MIKSIYSIAINEMFEPQSGCPICRIRDMLEKRCIEYIMDSAVMQPSIRMETNRNGFCTIHLKQMLARQNKLALALMLETHLDEIETKHVVSQIRSKKTPPPPVDTCFVCAEVKAAMANLTDNVLTLYMNDANFRYLFRKQEFFCFPHYDALCEKAPRLLTKKSLEQFMDEITEITRVYLADLKHNVHAFANMADYRKGNIAPDEHVLGSLERAIPFLTTRK